MSEERDTGDPHAGDPRSETGSASGWPSDPGRWSETPRPDWMAIAREEAQTPDGRRLLLYSWGTPDDPDAAAAAPATGSNERERGDRA